MTEEQCCEEFAGLSRRGLFKTGIGLAAGLSVVSTFGQAVLQETRAAAPGPADAVLVVLSLRGACDGLSLVVPHGDPIYAKARPTIAVPAGRLLAKDGFFGLHPELAPLLPMWNAGELAAVHATGLPVANRSHFAAMEAVEDADPGSSARVGWLNRLVGQAGANDPLRALQVGSSTVPTSLVGPRRTAAIRDVDRVRLAGQDDEFEQARVSSMQTIWGRAAGTLGSGGRSALGLVDAFAPIRASGSDPTPGAAYPDGDLGRALAAAARTIRADRGVEVIALDQGAWDMHAGHGTLEWGDMRSNTRELAKALAAFFADLGPQRSKVTVVTISEFGRRVRENASGGTDHGHGNVMFLLGEGVNGGRYYGRWPGLTNTLDADVRVTLDYRSVLGEVVAKRMGASTAKVFPGVRMSMLGAVKTR